MQTKQRWLTNDPAEMGPGEEMWAICESCLTVLIYREDGSVGQRAATDAERDAVPPKIDTRAEPWATMFTELRKGHAELRDWVQAGCPGLTPALEAALPPGTRERLRRVAELPPATEPLTKQTSPNRK
jgi:hypothetical protein